MGFVWVGARAQQGRFRWDTSTVATGCFILASTATTCHAQERPTFKMLRYEEDWSTLREGAAGRDWWDPIKYIPLNPRRASFLSFGGELRQQYERYTYQEWGQEPLDLTGYFLQRILLHADWHLNPDTRVFAQLSSAIEEGRIGGPSPVDEDRFDLHQAFFDHRFAGSGLLIRGGRQELLLGSQRLIAVREGPNVRQSFDGLRLTKKTNNLSVDAIVVRPVQNRLGHFDNRTDQDRLLWGVYTTARAPSSTKPSFDLYLLGYQRESARFGGISGFENRLSLGTRIFGRAKGWDYNFESVWQTGRFGSGSIQAWTATIDGGYTFESAKGNPRLGMRAAIVSGDRNPNDGTNNTFNPLFPRGNYFGESALVGPANLVNLYPSVEVEVAPKLSARLGCDFFWRESVRDSLYGNALQLIRPGNLSQDRYIGYELSTTLEWMIDRHTQANIVYSRFQPGAFVRNSGPGLPTDFASIYVSYKF